jgi:hypothetical protein
MTKQINIENHEAWLLDYIEGNLNDSQETELLSFLSKHPELGDNIVDPDSFCLVPPVTQYENSNQLKKENNHEYLMIGYIENSLTKQEQNEFNTLLQNKTISYADVETYKQTILQPNLAIQYTNKNNLKKSIPLFRRNISVVAASIILVLITGFLINLSLNTSFRNSSEGLAINTNSTLLERDVLNAKKPISNSNEIDIENNNTKIKNYTNLNETQPVTSNNFTRIEIARLQTLKPKCLNVAEVGIDLAYTDREIPSMYENETIKITYIKNNTNKKFSDYLSDARNIDIPNPIKILKAQKEELLSLK